MCNLFENLSSSEWLLYISEWQYCNATISNIRVTTKVAVNSLLSEDPVLRDRGTAIIHNLACKEVKTVVCIQRIPSFVFSRPSYAYLTFYILFLFSYLSAIVCVFRFQQYGNIIQEIFVCSYYVGLKEYKSLLLYLLLFQRRPFYLLEST